MAEPKSKRVPPYLPFKTFLSSLDALSQGVPPKLDRSVWKGQSGINQGLIMNAYRYFGLVDANDASTDRLATLALHPDKRSGALKEMIKDQYMLVLDKCDVSEATMKMLENAFEAIYPVTGDTKQKAVTFFLKGARFSELPLSPYLLSQLRSTSKRPRRNRQRVPQEDSGSPSAPTPGLSSHAVKLAGGGRLTITISANPFMMPVEDRNFFFALVDMLQKYKDEHATAERSEGDDDAE